MQLRACCWCRDYGRLLRAGDLRVEGQQQGEAEYAFLLQSILICCSKPGIMQHRHVANQLLISDTLVQADPTLQMKGR
jgi:hypothetical protein